MTIMYSNITNAFNVFETTMNIVLDAENAQDLCRRIVHSDLLSECVRGAHIYTLNSRSYLALSAGYGEPFLDGLGEFSPWDDNPASNSIRTKNRVFADGSPRTDAFGALAVPFLRENLPIGCVVMVLASDCEDSPMSEQLSPVMSKLGAYFLETKGFAPRTGATPNGNESIEALTTRQLTILGYMGDGLTNFEISQLVLLSESTVRQETIRIYRALACGNRTETVAKARAMGVLPKLQFNAPPPPREIRLSRKPPDFRPGVFF